MNKKSIFTSTINSLKICKSLRNKEAVLFVEEIIKTHYSKIFYGKQKEEIFDIVKKTLHELTSSQKNSQNIFNLLIAINSIRKDLYNKEKIPFFYKEYDKYKKSVKPEFYFDTIKDNLLGKTVLDFGSGNGYFSLFLKKKKFNVISADVIDYRNSDVKDVPFVKLNNLEDMSSNLKSIDTTILVTVLHHISKKNIIQTLKNLSKSSKKIIIIEDIINIEPFINLNERKDKHNLTEAMKHLSTESRKDAINLIDFYGNVISQGLLEMNIPFEFKNSDEWKKLLEENNFENVLIDSIGFPEVSFHGFFQVKITADSKAN